MGARPDVQGRAVVRADAVVIEMQKANYIGAPQVFTLELACKQINEAFGGFGCFLVGSSIQRADWRDVDIRLILPDDQFRNLFPDSEINYELDCRWLILSSSLSMFLSKSILKLSLTILETPITEPDGKVIFTFIVLPQFSTSSIVYFSFFSILLIVFN